MIIELLETTALGSLWHIGIGFKNTTHRTYGNAIVILRAGLNLNFIKTIFFKFLDNKKMFMQ